MKDFMLIFRDTLSNTEAYVKMSPADMQADMERWNTWMNTLAEQGKMIGGQPLFATGKVVRGTAKKITDGPYIEGKDVVGGYLVIKAADLKEAVELSKGCPALSSPEGTVEVREIMPVM
jgi:hypothetical protein